MAGSESVSKCPHCGKPALSKWDSCPMGFMFDACPFCMFLYHQSPDLCPTVDRAYVWQIILNAKGDTLKSLRESLKSYNRRKLESTTFNYHYTGKEEFKALTRIGGERCFNLSSAFYKQNYDRMKPSVAVYERRKKKHQSLFYNTGSDYIPF